jgi:hypothetical protein
LAHRGVLSQVTPAGAWRRCGRAPNLRQALTMPTAGEQTQRNAEILTGHASGESVATLAMRFGLSRSRIKQVLRHGPKAPDGDARAIRLAEARRAEYRAVVDQLRGVAAVVPITQAAAKVGAYRVLLDGLDRLTALERALGLLPDDLGQLSDQRQLAETVLAVFVEFDVSETARRAVVQRLGAGVVAS